MAAAAVVLAAVAGFGVFFYVSGADKRAEDNAGLVTALVATADIAKGTTGEQALQAGLVHQAKVARSSVPPSIITSSDALVGRVAAGRIDTKQFITQQTFVDKNISGGGSLADSIATNALVAVTVQVDNERGVAGQIAPGDHVDLAVVADGGTAAPAGTTTSQYILRNVKVLAVGAAKVGSGADPGTAPIQNGNLLTFEVTSDDALTIISANKQSTLYLVLLPPVDPGPASSSAGTSATTTTTRPTR